MKDPGKSHFGLPADVKQRLIERMRQRPKPGRDPVDADSRTRTRAAVAAEVPDEYCRVEDLPGYQQVQIHLAAAKRFGIDNPFFHSHDGVATNTTTIAGKSYINFSSYNYLGLNGHPRVSQAAKAAIDRYGTSASASRAVSGERPLHRELEQELAAVYETGDCVVFVSGHATNVSTISCLFGKNDLILYDALAHNSILQGALLSGAKRLPFPHNDSVAVAKILDSNRSRYERVLIVIEGLYSMDGDIADISAFVELKRRFKAFLMVDEAHSFGVLGSRGFGIADHAGIDPGMIDIHMGTLSKSLAGCGGYVCGAVPLIENLKYNAPGFVYSVGMSPPLAASAIESLALLREEPARVAKLQENGRRFLELAKAQGLDTGKCMGYSVVPVILGSSVLSAKLSNRLFEHGINVQPIIYPAVEERAARLRFFLCATHTEDQIAQTIELICRELKSLKKNPVYKLV